MGMRDKKYRGYQKPCSFTAKTNLLAYRFATRFLIFEGPDIDVNMRKIS